MSFAEHARVRLPADIYDLKAGSIGTVISVHDGACTVEFQDGCIVVLKDQDLVCVEKSTKQSRQLVYTAIERALALLPELNVGALIGLFGESRFLSDEDLAKKIDSFITSHLNRKLPG